MPDIKMPILYQRSLDPAQGMSIRCHMQLNLPLVQHYSRLFQIMVMMPLQQGASSASTRLGTTEVRNSSMAKDSRMSFFVASSGPSDDCV